MTRATCSAPRDLVFLAVRIIEHFPECYHFFSESTTSTGRGAAQRNRNPLLYANLGRRRPEDRPYAGGGLRPRRLRGAGRPADHLHVGRPPLHPGAGAADPSGCRLGLPRVQRPRALRRGRQSLGRRGLARVAQPGAGRATAAEDALAAVARGGQARPRRSRYEGPVEAPVAKGDRVAELVDRGARHVGERALRSSRAPTWPAATSCRSSRDPGAGARPEPAPSDAARARPLGMAAQRGSVHQLRRHRRLGQVHPGPPPRGDAWRTRAAPSC